jgi:hypothetical protein
MDHTIPECERAEAIILHALDEDGAVRLYHLRGLMYDISRAAQDAALLTLAAKGDIQLQSLPNPSEYDRGATLVTNVTDGWHVAYRPTVGPKHPSETYTARFNGDVRWSDYRVVDVSDVGDEYTD